MLQPPCPTYEAAKNAIQISPLHRENIAAYMSHLATALDMLKTNAPGSRNISTTQSYGGRGQGRGRSGRGGRGRGRGRGGRGTSAFDSNDPGRSYNPVEWRTLSAEEQARCRAARAETPAAGARPRTAGAAGTEAAAPAPAPKGMAEPFAQ